MHHLSLVHHLGASDFSLSPSLTTHHLSLSHQTHACQRYGWLLAWSRFHKSKCTDERRLLDPLVANRTTANATITPGVAAAFAKQWLDVTKSRSVFPHSWSNLTDPNVTVGGEHLVLFNIGARDCVDYDNCVGLTRAGECVCYSYSVT